MSLMERIGSFFTNLLHRVLSDARPTKQLISKRGFKGLRSLPDGCHEGGFIRLRDAARSVYVLDNLVDDGVDRIHESLQA
jgi:hypothetical protein